jgi:flavin-dependent dehydrogenase
VDPLSGEGIFYALKSAELASKVIVETLSGRTDLNKYTDLVNQEILPELKKAKLVTKIFFPFSKLLHRLFNNKQWILKQLVKVIYGGESYSELYGSLKSEVPFLKFKG